jgi:muconolactone delta-isomerase
MKFLIISRVKNIAVDVWAKLLPAHFKFLDDLEKKKKVETSYHIIGQQGDVLIVDVDSDEELASIIGEDPLFFYSEREVYPLTTREAHKRRLQKILGKAVTSAKTS